MGGVNRVTQLDGDGTLILARCPPVKLVTEVQLTILSLKLMVIILFARECYSSQETLYYLV